jgi:hypothetical protein
MLPFPTMIEEGWKGESMGGDYTCIRSGVVGGIESFTQSMTAGGVSHHAKRVSKRLLIPPTRQR